MTDGEVTTQPPPPAPDAAASPEPPGTLIAVLARTATGWLIAANVAIYLAITLHGGLDATSEFAYLVGLGAKHNPSIRAGEVWRLVSCCFLHIGFVHLAMNMLALFDLGLVLEVLLGRWLFVATYTVSGVCASALSYYRSQNLSAGASGAIFGVVGALLALGYLAPERVPEPLRARVGRGIVPLLLYNVGIAAALSSYLDNWAHAGGFIAGALFSALLVALLRAPRAFAAFSRIAGAAGGVVLLAGLGQAARHAPAGLALVESIHVDLEVLEPLREFFRKNSAFLKAAATASDLAQMSKPELVTIRDGMVGLLRVRTRTRQRLETIPLPLRDPATTRLVTDLKQRFRELPGMVERVAALPASALGAALEKDSTEHAAEWSVAFELMPVIESMQRFVAHLKTAHHLE